MRKNWLALPLIALAIAGCGVRPSGVIPGAPAPVGPSGATPGEPGHGAVLYFLSGGEPVRVQRRLDEELSLARTVELLAAGPDESERERRYTSEVPLGTRVLDQETGPDDAMVTLSAGVAGLSARAVDQIVCTVMDSLGGTARITLRGGGTDRGPLSCPVPR
ncbi:GerMN domain-containing protein [Amycolatopsis sp. cmx-11-12]|uniref:GerMN domain-containing protein n=1 Tax=Amycolatopsis sp. cmx-11-12 TaxID=2785795 RepID=UPI003917DA8F